MPSCGDDSSVRSGPEGDKTPPAGLLHAVVCRRRTATYRKLNFARRWHVSPATNTYRLCEVVGVTADAN